MFASIMIKTSKNTTLSNPIAVQSEEEGFELMLERYENENIFGSYMIDNNGNATYRCDQINGFGEISK